MRLLVAVLLLCVATDLAAQRRPTGRGDGGRAPTRPQDVDGPRRGAPGDTTRAGRDSTEQRPLVAWAEDDSVMKALLERRGYRVTRYQGDSVGFVARTRLMTLAGGDSAKSAVEREGTTLVARRLLFNDSTQVVTAQGDSIVLRDPARGEDVIGLGEMSYDVARREGRARDVSTVAASGADWKVEAHRAAFASDTTRSVFWGRDGLITSCLDSVPHYHFEARELKRISNSILVARPAVVFVQGVPVAWLPFIFQDTRTGRRSGILTPRVGVGEVVRNSPTYRRQVEDLGYYFALSDYYDLTVDMDWRSGARATDRDPGFLRTGATFNYRWLDRFISGGVALSQNRLTNGLRNTSVSWSHSQEFSSRTRFSANVNYVTNTSVQRQSIINPAAALATIASQANFVRQQGPFTVNLGGTQRQYPGRDQVDRGFPSLNVSSRPLTLGEWFVITPNFVFNQSEQLNIDAAGDFAYRYTTTPGGGLDSTRLTRDSRNRTMSLGVPFRVFDFQVNADLRFQEVANDFPEIKRVPDPANPGQFIDRVYARTFLSTLDYTFSAGLPQFFKGTWNLAPQVSLVNVDPAGSFVRSERTNGAWVAQSKRLSYGVGVSPTFFAFLPGLGSIERLRHSVTPTLAWSYSPPADVNPEFLEALGKTTTGYLGGLAQNRLSLALATNIEAKRRVPGDTSGNGEKFRLASLQFTALQYDFELARQTGRSGFATERLGYTFRSDLLPGFDLGVDYSLFEGSVLSDTARFAPYRESVRFGFSLSDKSALVRGIGRLFGAAPAAEPRDETAAADDNASANPLGGGLVSSADPNQNGMGAVTGTRRHMGVAPITTSGFQARFSVSQQRLRPPRGDRVIDFDPTQECQAFVGLPVYEFCIQQASQARPTDPAGGLTGTEGGIPRRYPPKTNIGLQTSFNLTPKWSAGWTTSYDAETRQFAAQTVTLQRDLHDWQAVFGFNRFPTGTVNFVFYISLKAQPEVMIPYRSTTLGGSGGGLTR